MHSPATPPYSNPPSGQQPTLLRSSTNRILRSVPERDAQDIQIDSLEALPYSMDGRPVTAELRAAKDAGFRKGWETGWRDGHDHGRDEAFKEFTAALAPTIEAISRVREQLAAADRVSADELASQLVQFAMSVAEAVIGRELELSSNSALDSLRRALVMIPERGEIVARLNPDDVAIVDSVEHLVPGRVVTIAADPSVERGGAVVQVGRCHIDAQIGPALDRVREALGLS
jgi:flagellar assembly protein FliH